MAKKNQELFLTKLNENLAILQQREAAYTGSTQPAFLIKQISDHQEAIALTKQAIAGELSEADWEKALEPLRLAVDNGQVVNIRVGPEEVGNVNISEISGGETNVGSIVTGHVDGDIISGDEIGGDKVAGNKIINLFRGDRGEARDYRNRQMMLKLVNDIWVKGVLEESLHGTVLIELGLEERQDTVEHPWEMVLRMSGQPAESLSLDTRIVDVFDDRGQELLILGEPGSGKTTMLLELARDAIVRAKQDPTHPLPVVFNLSSWAVNRQPIAKWLMDELNTKYNIPKKIAQPWVESDELLLLLDGLDEVVFEYREACVQAINDYRREHLTPLVVCSRIADYEALATRLKLQGAICLQPLTLQQIGNYLKDAGPKGIAMWEILQEDPTLQELAQSPLMLSVMTLAYRDSSFEELKSLDSVEARLKRIFDTYVQQMFKRRDTDTRYTPQQTLQWLGWLARIMSQHAQSEFYIEGIQPTWLPAGAQRLLYNVYVRLIGGLGVIIVGILAGELGFVLAGLLAGELTTEVLLDGLTTGLWVGLAFGIAFEVASILALKVPSWLAIILASGLTILPINFFVTGGRALVAGLGFGLPAGLAGVLFSRANKIKVVDKLNWSWRKSIPGLGVGIATGLVVALIVGLVDELITGLNTGLSLGIPVGIAFMLILGLRRNELVDARRTPNQGIWQSARNATWFGPGVVLSSMFFGLVLGFLSGKPGPGVAFGLIAGLPVGLIVGLFVGGTACIQHIILRFMLYYHGHIPWSLVPFLDYVAERVLLRKVGGGYIFVHRLLLDYFAAYKP